MVLFCDWLFVTYDLTVLQMQGKIAIFMCNLKPAKMRGVFSHGMIMCGSTPEKVEIINPPSGVQKGDRIYVDGYEGLSLVFCLSVNNRPPFFSSLDIA